MEWTERLMSMRVRFRGRGITRMAPDSVLEIGKSLKSVDLATRSGPTVFGAAMTKLVPNNNNNSSSDIIIMSK